MATTAQDCEPPAGKCHNCRTALVGQHCHGCGQPAHVHRSVKGIGHELMHGVMHLDGKLASTLPLLAFRPGQLTRRYIAGERRRFVSPLGMFLFSVTILFLAMQVLGLHAVDFSESELAGPALARAEASLATVAQGGEGHEGSVSGQADIDGSGGAVAVGVDAAEQAEITERARAALPFVKRASALWGETTFERGRDSTGNAAIDTAVDKITKDPALVAYKVQANSYKFSWALIPLSVPFVWLLFFWRRDLGLYDHTVFVTYSIAAMTLLTVGLMVLSTLAVPGGVIGTALFLIAPLHIFVHLRGSYGLSKRATLVRVLFLSVFIWLAVALFAIILFALGALG